jgi:transcriptional regulator with XRE-family HTH domain
MTQAELADELTVSRITLTRWETGVMVIENPGMLRLAMLGLKAERGRKKPPPRERKRSSPK